MPTTEYMSQRITSMLEVIAFMDKHYIDELKELRGLLVRLEILADQTPELRLDTIKPLITKAIGGAYLSIGSGNDKVWSPLLDKHTKAMNERIVRYCNTWYELQENPQPQKKTKKPKMRIGKNQRQILEMLSPSVPVAIETINKDMPNVDKEVLRRSLRDMVRHGLVQKIKKQESTRIYYILTKTA